MANFERPILLTELIESNIHFGVSKLVFYYYSFSENVKQILKYYSSIGIVDVYEFQNDTHFKETEGNRVYDIYHFILFKINHCFNEYKTKSNHMIFLDLDEILWPVRSKNYKEMLESIPPKEFYYIHAFFYKCNFDIPNHLDKSINTILPDIDIFSIKKYCPNNDEYTHKYLIANTSKFLFAHIHDAHSKFKISKEYMFNNISYIRHTRHYDNGLKNHCPDSKLLQTKRTKVESIILKKSKAVVNGILKLNLKIH